MIASRHRAAGHGRRRASRSPTCWRGSPAARAAASKSSARSTTFPKGSRLAVSTNLLACLIAVCMRATGQTTSLTGVARGRRAPAGGRARDPRRMARRLRRRLAGLRRRLAGHQADRGRARPARAIRSSASAAAACCRNHEIFGTDRGSASDAREAAGEPGARARRHGAERRARSSRWSPRNTCCAPRPSGTAASRRSAFSTKWWATCEQRRHRAPSARAPQTQFRRADPDHHSVGRQPLHRDADRPRARRIRRGLLGLLDARRHVRRRHGLHLRPQRKAEAQERMQAIMSETKRALEHAVPFAMEPVVYDFAINERGTQAELLSGDDGADARRLLRARRAAAAAHRSAQPALAAAPRRARPLRRRLPRPPEIAPAWCRTSSTACCRARRTQQTGRGQSLRSAARDPRLRPRAARADPGRPARRPHRPGAESPAGQQPHRGRARRTTSFDAAATAGRYRELGMAGAGATARSPSSRWPAASAAAGRRARAWSRRCNPFCKLGGRHRTFVEVAPGQEPARSAARAARCCRTSSPPAT